MDPNEFYYSTLVLLGRLGYATSLDELDPGAGNKKAAQIKKWYGRIARGAETLFELEMPDGPPVHIPFEKFSEKKFDALKTEWRSLTRDFPVAGLRYAHGKPLVFGARFVGQGNMPEIIEIFEGTHAEFDKFAYRYEAAFSESGRRVCDLCFAFSSNDAFEEARTMLRKNQGGFWSDVYTVGWFFNLGTLELATTNRFSLAHVNMLETGALFLASNTGVQSLDAWKAPSGIITGGVVGPKTYLQFMRLFEKLREQGKIEIPADFAAGSKDTNG